MVVPKTMEVRRAPMGKDGVMAIIAKCAKTVHLRQKSAQWGAMQYRANAILAP